MRKFVMCFCILLITFSLVACKERSTLDDVIVDIEGSTKFEEKDIEKAVNCVKDNFSFPGSTLKKLWYDEEESNLFIEGYLNNGKGSINGVSPENVIVLLSNFHVDGSGDNPVLNPNTTYTDYKWILIREDKTGDWIVDDCGY